jgi:hypothetical protein
MGAVEPVHRRGVEMRGEAGVRVPATMQALYRLPFGRCKKAIRG